MIIDRIAGWFNICAAEGYADAWSSKKALIVSQVERLTTKDDDDVEDSVDDDVETAAVVLLGFFEIFESLDDEDVDNESITSEWSSSERLR